MPSVENFCGMTYAVSDAYDDALKRLGQLGAEAGEEALADPQQASRHMDQIGRDTQLFPGERKRLPARNRYGVAVMAVVMLLAAAWPWIRAWLRF